MRVLASLQDSDSVNNSHEAQESCREKVSCRPCSMTGSEQGVKAYLGGVATGRRPSPLSLFLH